MCTGEDRPITARWYTCHKFLPSLQRRATEGRGQGHTAPSQCNIFRMQPGESSLVHCNVSFRSHNSNKWANLKRRKSKPEDKRNQSQKLRNSLNNSDSPTYFQGPSTLAHMVVNNHHNIPTDFKITNLPSLSQDGEISDWLVSTEPKREGEDQETQEKRT